MGDAADRKVPLPDDPEKDTTESERLFKEFIDRVESGETVDPDEYFTKYPELEDDLKVLFETLKDRISRTGGKAKRDGGGVPVEKDQLLGEFKILREIGHGGMGVVYEAEQVPLGRAVALKVLPRHLRYSDRAVRKFQREAEAGGKQNHPGIVAIYAIGEHEGVHYIAQELVEGGYTLADRLKALRKERGLLEDPSYYRQLSELILSVADALAHAHASGVIHRDVKPSNILLTPDGVPKLSDFGLAKVENALALSRTGDFSGTPYYMSPEQAMSRRMGIDHRTDIFSLGVAFYEALTLARPFDGETSQEVLKKVIMHDPKDPRRLNARIPRDLAVICLRALEKNPDDRYSTMQDFAGDLRRFLAGEVILARPVSSVTKAWRRVRRNPGISAAVAVAVLSIAALLVVLATLEGFTIPFEVTLYEGAAKDIVGVMCRNITDANYDQSVRIQAEWSEPFHCFLFALNNDGSTLLLHPSDKESEPLKIRKIAYPAEGDRHYDLEDTEGLQFFILLRSKDPLPAFKELKEKIGIEQWQHETVARTWAYDGRKFKDYGPRMRDFPPKSFLNILDNIQELHTMDSVQFIAFPVRKP